MRWRANRRAGIIFFIFGGLTPPQGSSIGVPHDSYFNFVIERQDQMRCRSNQKASNIFLILGVCSYFAHRCMGGSPGWSSLLFIILSKLLFRYEGVDLETSIVDQLSIWCHNADALLFGGLNTSKGVWQGFSMSHFKLCHSEMLPNALKN